MAPTPAPVPAQIIRTYPNQNAANAGINRMARDGWRFVSQSAGSYRKAGCLSWILWGPLMFFRKNKARDITVVFTK